MERRLAGKQTEGQRFNTSSAVCSSDLTVSLQSLPSEGAQSLNTWDLEEHVTLKLQQNLTGKAQTISFNKFIIKVLHQ